MKTSTEWMKVGRPDIASHAQNIGKYGSYICHGLCEALRAEPLLRLADKGTEKLRSVVHERCESYLERNRNRLAAND